MNQWPQTPRVGQVDPDVPINAEPAWIPDKGDRKTSPVAAKSFPVIGSILGIMLMTTPIAEYQRARLIRGNPLGNIALNIKCNGSWKHVII